MRPATLTAPRFVAEWPDHMGLPDEDGVPAQSALESPQSTILCQSFESRLKAMHPDFRFMIGCNSGIYFDYTDPVLDGCRAPDWFYVPGVFAMLDGKVRRSLVMWKELVRPYLLIEYVGGDGSEERDRTPGKGKFWIYENAIGAGYYVIFDSWQRTLEVFVHDGDGYRPVAPNQAGRFLIEGPDLELGIWDGTYYNMTAPWLRVWDPATGEMVPHAAESVKLFEERTKVAELALKRARARAAEQVAELDRLKAKIEAAVKLEEYYLRQADEYRKQGEAERQRSTLLAVQLPERGIDPVS